MPQLQSEGSEVYAGGDTIVSCEGITIHSP